MLGRRAGSVLRDGGWRICSGAIWKVGVLMPSEIHLIPAGEGQWHTHSPDCTCGPHEADDEPGAWIHKRVKPQNKCDAGE